MHYSNIGIGRHQSFRNKALFDLAIIPLAFIVIYLVSSHYNLSERFNFWAARYEQNLNIDELPLALLATLAAMAWFAARRWEEIRDLLDQNHQLLQHATRTQEQERRRIAQDLHDDLGQYLNAIKIDAASIIHDAANEDIKPIAQRIANHSSHAYQTAKQMMYRLRPVALDDLGLSAALSHLVSTWQKPTKQGEPATDYSIETLGEIDHLNEEIAIDIYRVVQEGLTNAARHANASQVNVNVHLADKLLSIRIDDNGCGIKPTAIIKGLGLAGMRERIEGLGGTFTLESSPKQGTHLKATIPTPL